MGEERWIPKARERCEGRWLGGSAADAGWVSGVFVAPHYLRRDDGERGAGPNHEWDCDEFRPLGTTGDMTLEQSIDTTKEASMQAYTWLVWSKDEDGKREGIVHQTSEATPFKSAENAKLAAWQEFVGENRDADPDGYEVVVIQVGV
jgi:hypothetical protein